MDVIRVPAATRHQPQIAAGEIAFMDYKDGGGHFRNQVMFDSYAFSFVQNGQKHIYRAGGNTIITAGQGMLIPEGNSIIAEHSNNSNLYHSVIVFFPGKLGRDFIAGYSAKNAVNHLEAPYIDFKINAYIQEYVSNIRALIASKHKLSTQLASLKVQELLTAIYELAPDVLQNIFYRPTDISLKKLVENNLLNHFSVNELAFLANRSLSSFKRDFLMAYGVSPQKYIRERRLELACKQLAEGKLASELYLDYGYQHLSNFNTAFKRKYGMTPANYRQSA